MSESSRTAGRHGEGDGVRSRRAVLGKAVTLTGAALAATAMAPATARGATVAGRPAGAHPDGAYALTRATVIDATGAPARRDMTVVVSGARITAVGRTGTVAVPPGARVVDLAGKYVIPGLIESHVHSVGPTAVVPPLYALAGVTTVREMRGEVVHHEWRDEIESGRILGPRWVIGSAIVDGRPSLHTYDTGSLIEVANPGEGREAVRRAKRENADFVKVYSRLDRESYLAIADEARRLRIPFAGHCPDTVTLPEAVRAGQLTIEHMDSPMLATAANEKEIREGLAAITVDATQDSFHRYRDWYAAVHPLEYKAVLGYDRPKARALFAELAGGRGAVVPTLVIHRVLEEPEGNHETDEWRYLSASMTDWWREVADVVTGGRTPEKARRIREIFDHKKRLVGEMRRSGVRILAGTDTGNPFVVPGFGLHDELALLVDAGLTPMQALRAATEQPARVFGLRHDLGTVERGKLADLVILDADPLADIRNTRRIHALVVDGRLITQPERAGLLKEIEEAAGSEPPSTTGTATAHGCGCMGKLL
ncbi:MULTISPECIES: amidohydrolase family protein [unclassified Streptomyces]|uniref:amidohydrolase family protein n=1 Tax=unclassified Streptomyces TaxID=2593676 RepID=UPI000DD70855|nr:MULTISPECIES: amidohydrolase family protein [unclassified Streptomyces]QZZ25166.1 amidohydrolase family protein [Streptomyces sp. ST1015]